MRNLNKIFCLLLVCYSFASFAQHLSTNITSSGLRKIISSAIESSSKTKGKALYQIEGGPIYERIPVNFFSSNSIIQTINEYVPLQQDEDFVFYFNWSPINVEGSLIKDSLYVEVEGTRRNFSAAVRFSIEDLHIYGNYLEICELKKWKCDKKKHLYGKIKNYTLNLNRNSKLDMAAIVDIQINRGNAKVKFNKLITNLVAPKNSTEKVLYEKYKISTKPIDLNIDFKEFILPPLELSIDGEVINVNLSELKDALLAEKSFLAKKLTEFSSEFIATDLTKILNDKLFSNLTKLTTTIDVLDYGSQNSEIDKLFLDKFGNNLLKKPIENSRGSGYRDNTYMSDYMNRQVPVDNTYVHTNRIYDFKPKTPKLSFMEKISGVIKRIVKQADYNLTFNKIKSDKDKNITVNLNSTFSLNGKKWELDRNLRNGQAKLSRLNFNQFKSNDYDIAVALSEPMVNAALNIASDNDIFNTVIRDVAELNGIYITKVNLYFEQGKTSTVSSYQLQGRKDFEFHPFVADSFSTPSFHRPYELYDNKTHKTKKIIYQTKDSVVAVAQVMVSLSELDSDGFLAWISKHVGALLENGVIWFPIEIKFLPQIVIEDGKTYLELIAVDPIQNEKFVNTYNYPYKDMKGLVEKGLLKTIKKELSPLLKDIPRIDLTSYINLPGLKLQPKGIYLRKSGHLVITTDIDKLDLKTMQEMGGKSNE